MKNNLLLSCIVISMIICIGIYIYLSMEVMDNDLLEASQSKPLSRRKPMLDHESIFDESGPSMIRLSDLLAHCIVALRVAGKEIVDLSLAHNDKIDNVFSKGKTLEGADDVVTGADLRSHQMIVNTIMDSYSRLKVVSEEDTTNGASSGHVLPINRLEFARLLRQDLQDIETDHISKSNPLLAQHETLVWIDPLDATKEYSENLTEYVTLMACIVHKSAPVAGIIFKPFTNQTFWSMLDETTSISHHSPDLKELIIQKDKRLKSRHSIDIIVSRSHAGDVKNLINKSYKQKTNIIHAGGSGYKTLELIGGKVDAYIHLTNIKKWDICAPNLILQTLHDGNMTDLSGKVINFDDPQDKIVTGGLIATLNRKFHHDMVDSIIKMREG